MRVGTLSNGLGVRSSLPRSWVTESSGPPASSRTGSPSLGCEVKPAWACQASKPSSRAEPADRRWRSWASTNPDEGRLGVGGTTNGMLAKFIRYVGRAAHAGGAPERGVNALYAAHVALAGINALRETFTDDDHVRVHPIVTRGGDVVSAI